MADKMVFVVDPVRADIDCAWVIREDALIKKVRFKHGGPKEVPALLCHGTLDEAKKALIKRLRAAIEVVEDLRFVEDNFLVA